MLMILKLENFVTLNINTSNIIRKTFYKLFYERKHIFFHKKIRRLNIS